MPVAKGRVAFAHDEGFRPEGVDSGTAYGICCAHESQVLFLLSLEDAELVVGILLERFVPVQVIRPHIEERRDREAGVLEIVELEGGDFEDEQPRSTRLLQAPRAPAARKTGLRGLMPGLAMILSIPSSTSGPAPRTPDTPRAARVPRSRSSSPPSATRTALPLSVRARVAATPDSPSPYTRVLTGSPCRVVEEDVVEEEPHGGESGLGDPESDHHLVLVPAQKLEVVVYGGHLEYPSSR